MIILTGDTHGDFIRIQAFCEKQQTTPSDILVILGDAGINYHGGTRDEIKKTLLSHLPITVFCIHGNHEERPEHIPTYRLTEWHGGQVWVEPDYPNILFAKDGEIYDFGGKKAIAIGGAYSIDRQTRVIYGGGWWSDEQPSEAVKRRVEARLERENWTVEYVFSHTLPLKYEPTETFFSSIDQSTVDRSTEAWLDTIEQRLTYGHWYCGHYHTNKTVDKLTILFETYVELR